MMIRLFVSSDMPYAPQANACHTNSFPGHFDYLSLLIKRAGRWNVTIDECACR